MIQFFNTEQVQAGRNIRHLRERRGQSLEECARKAEVAPEYLDRLEGGCLDRVPEAAVERILYALGFQGRDMHNGDDLKRLLLSVTRENPPDGARLL